jgi:hypothetical protein
VNNIKKKVQATEVIAVVEVTQVPKITRDWVAKYSLL